MLLPHDNALPSIPQVDGFFFYHLLVSVLLNIVSIVKRDVMLIINVTANVSGTNIENSKKTPKNNNTHIFSPSQS